MIGLKAARSISPRRVALRVGELGGGDEPPVAGPEGGLLVEPPREADARHEPAGPGVRLPLAGLLGEVEGAVVGVARGARRLGHDRPDVGGDLRVDRLGHARDGVREVELLREPVLGVPQAALVLVAQPQVERDLLGDLPVVLDVEAVELRVGDLQLPVLHVRGAGVDRPEQEARPGVPGGRARARPPVGRRGRDEAQVGVEEARGVAALPADLGAGLDRVLVQVLVEPGVDAVALGLLVPVVRDPELVPRRALHDDVGRVDERPALGVRLPPAARPQVRVALFAHDHVGVLALVLDLVEGPADVEGRRGVEGVDGVRGDVPAVALRAGRVAQLQRVVAVRVVVRVLVRLHAADARVGLPAVVDVPVEAGREVEVVEGPLVLGLEVVEAGRVVARVVGLPQAGQDLRGHGVPAIRGDHVARGRGRAPARR